MAYKELLAIIWLVIVVIAIVLMYTNVRNEDKKHEVSIEEFSRILLDELTKDS